MKIRYAMGLLLALAAVARAGAEAPPIGAPTFEGRWTQGGIIKGQVSPATRVWFGDRELRLTDDGRFVLGLHRDAPAQAVIEYQLPGQEKATLRHDVAPRTYEIQRIDGLPSAQVSPPAEALERIRGDYRQVRRARGRDTARPDFAGKFIWPCVGPVSGVFGSQRILNGTPKQPHYGVDVAVPEGTPVIAPAGGIVSLAATDMYYTGGTLMIDHGHGLSSAFLHLSKLHVKAGQEVRQGDLIGEVGATGRATGPHLDWRVNWFDARVDAAFLVGPMPDEGPDQ